MRAKDLLFPYERIAGAKALIIGVTIVFATGMIGYYTNTRFDGILNVHSGIDQAKWLYPIEPLISILIMSLWLVLMCKIFSKKPFRIIDIIGTQYFAFFPMIPLVFLGSISAFDKLTLEAQQVMNDNAYSMNLTTMDIGIIGLALIVVMLMVFWSGWLMYNALQVSANLKHKLAIPIFISGLIIGNVFPRLIF